MNKKLLKSSLLITLKIVACLIPIPSFSSGTGFYIQGGLGQMSGESMFDFVEASWGIEKNKTMYLSPLFIGKLLKNLGV